MPAYDRGVISEFANRLYGKAETVILTYTAIGVLFGGSACLFSKTSGIILATVFGVIGFLFGSEKAFWYRFQAQVALCQAEIEFNTSRNTSGSGIPIHPPLEEITASSERKEPIDNTRTAFSQVCECGNPKLPGKACKKCGRT